MENKKVSFSDYALADKISAIVSKSRDHLMKEGSLKNNLFLFDNSGKAHMVPITNDKFIRDYDYKTLFNKVAESLIEEIEAKHKTLITNSLYIYKDVFNYTLDNNIDLDLKYVEDEVCKLSMIVLQENKFNLTLHIYDCITSDDFVLVSPTPIKKYNLSKLDADHKFNGFLTNLL